jgi:hypothetical protein
VEGETIYSTFKQCRFKPGYRSTVYTHEEKDICDIKNQGQKKIGTIGRQVAISITNECDVDQESSVGSGKMEWSVITPLIRLYTASGYCLPRDNNR